MRAVLFTLLCGVAVSQAVEGQAPGRQRRELQQQVVQRFMQNVRVQAGLSDDQFEQFGNVTRDSFEERATLARQEAALWRALEGQMRPGVAAEADSIAVLMTGIADITEERAALTRVEMEQFETFLDPVQRAQVMLAWRRLQLQIDRILQGRTDQPMRRRGNERPDLGGR